MPAALLSRDDDIERLMRVLRRNGYDGESLAELSKATGLRFEYERHDHAGQWYRSYGNELWEFDEGGLNGATLREQ